MTADPVKTAAWQQRGARAYANRRRAQAVHRAVDGQPPQTRSRNRKPRRNDAPWREECLDRRGRYCRACAAGLTPPDGGWLATKLEADHVMPRGQGGPSMVENGIIWCASHHRLKTDGLLLIRFEWLEPDQVAWLAAVGWCWWDDAGQPNGRGFKHFAARSAA